MLEDFERFKSRYILLDCIGMIFLLGLLLALILMAIAAITGQKSNAFLDTNNPFYISITSCFFSIGICLTIFWRLKSSHIQPQQIIGDFSLRSLPLLMLLSIFFGIECLIQGISQLTTFSIHLIAPKLATSALESGNSLFEYDTESILLKTLFYILLAFYVVIVAPITEEFIFRGVLLHRFAVKWGVTWALLVSSFLFGLAHLNIYAISLGINSIFFALIYLKTQTLIVPIMFHGMHNAIVMISHIIYQISYPNNSVEVTPMNLWGGLVNTGFALAILFYFFKWPSQSELMPYAANSNNPRISDR